ncbi:MAG: RNA-binding S4 domain-containing protein [Gallionella sp.]
MSTDDQTEKFRIDKWLCAARFFKTRSLAADAVVCGKVQINDARVKPARTVAVGDMITINIGQKQYVVEVTGLSNRRGPAAQAQKLYLETDASRQRREAIAAELKSQPQPFFFRGRPTKRDRREIERLKRGK